MPRTVRSTQRTRAFLALVALMLGTALSDAVRAVPTEGDAIAAAALDHLVISEVMTGGAGASDEFVELYNPSDGALPLDGLELIYVTASGATITRKATWGAGSAVPPASHVLVANEAGIFAGVADGTYAGGLAATGGSMALRTIGSPTAIDAVGWGTAVSVWLETAPAPAPAAGSSLERLPGGALGSGQDTDHNLVDFVARTAPDPQNSTSPPVPSPTPTPTPSPIESVSEPTRTPGPTDTPPPTATPSDTPDPTPTAAETSSPTATTTPTAIPTPSPLPLTVAEARSRSDGSPVVLAGVAITNSDFTEGGGYVADATGGIAVLVDGASFIRGASLVISGIVDDRFAQRTVRAEASGLTVVGSGTPPETFPLATGSVGEPVEGQLVTLSGVVQGSPTVLAAGIAYEVDDGSGSIRILVGPGTGIDTTSWTVGGSLGVTGVVGQRDSSGTGVEGYRVQPRDPADIAFVMPPATPTPAPSPSSSSSPSASPGPSLPPLVTIADVRRADVGTRLRIRGVVTFPTSVLDADTAVVADPSGAILVRTGSEVGRLVRGRLVELSGTRSTKAGMASLRVTEPALMLGTQPEPLAMLRPTGAIGEPEEATLVIVRGIVGDGPRRTTGGGLSFTLDDGSGTIRVFAAPAAGITAPSLPAGAWVELRGVVGQETTAAEPNAGYRLWPRDRADVRVIAGPVSPGGRTSSSPTRPSRPPTDPSTVAASLPEPELRGSVAPSPVDLPVGEGSLAGTLDAALPPAARISIPLAGGVSGMVGLLTLAWRRGTLRRLADQIVLAAQARGRVSEDGSEEDESYTPAP
ncbi:MAG: lamin tail domain-containing protein [Candidatus Limnocylindria bacterium]